MAMIAGGAMLQGDRWQSPNKIEQGWRQHLCLAEEGELHEHQRHQRRGGTEAAERRARRGNTVEEMGPYLSERQWGTVREDYSSDGNAWDYFTHDQSRSQAYKWGEDGLGGICDEK